MNDLLVTYLTNGAGNNVPKNLSEFIHEYVDLQALNRILRGEYPGGNQGYRTQIVDTLLAESSISYSVSLPPLSYYYM